MDKTPFQTEVEKLFSNVTYNLTGRAVISYSNGSILIWEEKNTFGDTLDSVIAQCETAGVSVTGSSVKNAVKRLVRALQKKDGDIYRALEQLPNGFGPTRPWETSNHGTRTARQQLIDTVDATGGMLPSGCPAADEDWLDLGEAYLAACKEEGVLAHYRSEHSEDDDDDDQ